MFFVRGGSVENEVFLYELTGFSICYFILTRLLSLGYSGLIFFSGTFDFNETNSILFQGTIGGAETKTILVRFEVSDSSVIRVREKCPLVLARPGSFLPLDPGPQGPGIDNVPERFS